MKPKKSWVRSFTGDVWKVLVSLGQYFGKLFDQIVYNNKASLIVSGLFAVIFCVSINFNELRYQLFHTDAATLTLDSIPVEALYDSDLYEVSGLPATADITIEGDAADIQLVKTQNSAAVKADMRNLSEGTNVVELSSSGLPSGLLVEVDPSTAEVTLQRKVAKTFFIEPELLVGVGQQADMFNTPVLSAKTVTITATQEKLNSIRTVKAIIDTSNQGDDFTIQAPLVAYDSSGKQILVDMQPVEVEASVALKRAASPATDDESQNSAKASSQSSDQQMSSQDSSQSSNS